MIHTSCPLSLPHSLRLKAKQCTYFYKNCCILCASPLVNVGPISSSHVFVIIGASGLIGNSSLMPKVDMGASKLEVPIPCAFEVPSTFSSKFKILNAKNAFDTCSPHSKHWASWHPSPFPFTQNPIIGKYVWPIWDHQMWPHDHVVPLHECT